MSRPVTEESNSLSAEIDIASPADIVSILQRCDKEIFSGYKDHKSLFDTTVIQTIERVASYVQQVLKNPGEGLVVFSGCGTSGRLGFMVSRTFNEFQTQESAPQVFKYLIAGGDKALFTSQEAPEDDPRVGVEALKKVSSDKSLVVFVGITCGLSAPYVAGQLEYCMDHSDTFVPVLLGFNPVHLARNIEIETWDKTFLQIARRLETLSEQTDRAFILNPIVGPEPITGSSRMKSGSATKILLETVCLKALYDHLDRDPIHWSVSNLMQCYQKVSEAVYSQKQQIARVLQRAGDSLLAGGHLYYIGKDSLGIMAMIDGTECPPTYGASLDDVRGFVCQGFQTLRNSEGDLSHLGKHFRIDENSFLHDIQFSASDTVVFVSREGKVTVPECVQKSGCNKVLLTLSEPENPSQFDEIVMVTIETGSIDELIGEESRQVAYQLLCEMAIKWCVNAVSTGAHILKGKVYQNFMVDVTVSNNKLFHRAVGIIQRLTRVSQDEAKDCLLRSIYELEELTDAIRSAPLAKHIATATPKTMVVSVALFIAVSKATVSDARRSLSQQPIVRTAITDLLKNVA